MVIDMNLGKSNGGKQPGRKKSSRNESTHKKNKPPQRGLSVAQLERIIGLQDDPNTLTPSSLHPLPIPISYSVANPAYTTSSSCTPLSNGGVQFRYGYPPAIPTTPVIMFNGSGSNPFGSDHVISSIPNYIKCAYDGCGVCHKKIRIHGGSNSGVVNYSRYYSGNYSGGAETVDTVYAGKARSNVTEYEFFPGKGAAGTATWCGSGGGSGGGGGMIGLRGGEGSCVTAVTGNEETSVSSVDLSLKLSY